MRATNSQFDELVLDLTQLSTVRIYVVKHFNVPFQRITDLFEEKITLSIQGLNLSWRSKFVFIFSIDHLINFISMNNAYSIESNQWTSTIQNSKLKLIQVVTYK